MSMTDGKQGGMTSRQRYIETLTFGQPDRIFYSFGNPRKSTMNAWFLQGLPRMPDAGDYGCPDEFFDMVGIERALTLPIRTDAFPPFEVRIIEENEKGRIWIDEKGITMHDAGHDLTTPGFRTRSLLSHPVKNRADWLKMRDERFDPHATGRYPDDWPVCVERFNNRDRPLQVTIQGFYWKARDWVGFENLSLMLHDDPALVHDMMEHITEFSMALLERALLDVEVDSVFINEDMTYKQRSMISPKMFREFMLPRYKRMIRFLEELN